MHTYVYRDLEYNTIGYYFLILPHCNPWKWIDQRHWQPIMLSMLKKVDAIFFSESLDEFVQFKIVAH